MHTPSARYLPSAALTVAATVTGSLIWAPAAFAQTPDQSPAASTMPTSRAAAEGGGVAILKKDAGGDVLAGASFTLYDSTGKEAGSGKTDAQGQLIFQDLAPGVYRLKEVSSGSPLHDVVADQDVIVTPGAVAPLTVIDPFKPAEVTLKAKDDKSGKLLVGATVNIGSGDKTILTLTTGSDGTASAQLPINSRTGSDFWLQQTAAPAGYALYKPSKSFTANPGDPVIVTVTNAKKTSSTTPAPTSSAKPSDEPTTVPTTPGTTTPAQGNSTASSSSAPSETLAGDETAPSSTAPTATGALAHTGADATPWLFGGAGILLAAGAGAVFAARRRTEDDGHSIQD
ncbi:hypothetical protein AQJ67_10200 [Streptomyces caeruleatus]|uniref:SpaA-like prealbumin fold domain-containing protein n=1 Tax=Streptomyces caeruleatus TaxID=661399 RepID=A0A101U5P0_9ACTN|nr:hypothetical protein AQJ67_10200 [Streptomyces caeruleatus]